MEMEAKIWQNLPENLLYSILARLPVRVLGRLRTVSKQWNSLLSSGDALQQTYSKFSVHSTPGFFIHLNWSPGDLETWVVELGRSGSDINIYKSPFLTDQIVFNACKSIYCCHKKGDRLDLSIGNPATRTWKRLPRPACVDRYWEFNAMAFDSTSKRCIILLGKNKVEVYRGQLKNSMVLEIYNSESNAWTRVSVNVPWSIQPHGKGLYSKGKVYWVILLNYMSFTAVFDIANSSWTDIRLPEGCSGLFRAFLYLTGCDGRVVLIHNEKAPGCIRLWRLNESQGAAEWSEPRDICRPESHVFYSVVANSGWVMMFGRGREIYLFNSERKLSKKILLPRPQGYLQLFISAFESNNIWWP